MKTPKIINLKKKIKIYLIFFQKKLKNTKINILIISNIHNKIYTKKGFISHELTFVVP
jgi:hypothetical protein